MVTKRTCSLWLLAMALLSCDCFAQTNVKGLEQTLKGQQLQLRSFSADPVAKYVWADGKLVGQSPQVHTLGIFVPDSVKLKGGRVMIQGMRSTLVHDIKADKTYPTGKSPMTLEINLGDADPAMVLPQLSDNLFFPDLQAAENALPAMGRKMLPMETDRTAIAHLQQSCRCANIYDDGQWKQVSTDDGNVMEHPKLTKSVEPEFTDAIRTDKTSGPTVVNFFVTKEGAVTDLWLARSAGPDRDLSGEAAVRRYQFVPAKYNGTAVGTRISVEIKFEIF